MVLEIQEKDNTFRVKWQVNSQGFSTDWIPDTPSNRKSVLVLLRLLRNDKGKAHYQEEYLLTEMMRSFSPDLGQKTGIEIPESQGMTISDPTSIKKLITPDTSLFSVKESLKWVVYCMVLYYYGLPLSVLGSWLNVHKTTILRWMFGLCQELFPYVYKWIIAKVKAKVVYIEMA